MRGKIYTAEEKLKVEKLILSGKSYKEITTISGVPKSTISTWFGKTIRKPWDKKTMLKHLASIRKLAVVALKERWRKIKEREINLLKEKIKSEILNYPISNIGFHKSLLAMLYWAEGDKYDGGCRTKFANTNPDLAKLYITLLRNCYNIDETKLKVRLYVHYYHSLKKVKKFWSEILNIPLTQFNKVYIKKRSKTKKFRKNFAGICFIYYGDSKIAKELIELGMTLQRIIVKNAPVAQGIECKAADFEVVGSNPTRRTNASRLYRGNFI